MQKLRFDFVVGSKADGKTNLICLTSIGTPDGRTFAIPEDFQAVSCHKAIMGTTAYAKVAKTLTKRHQERKIWINLTKVLSEIYLDEGENLQFGDVFLEEITNVPQVDIVSEQPLVKMLEKLLAKSQEQSESRNVGKIAKEFTIEKFSGKNSNAEQWITSFEKECERFNILEDEKKIEILKSFMDKGATDWYGCTLLKLTIEAKWEEWKKTFCDTFTSRGWSQIRYALSFKYQAGSLLEYAMKKEKLLLEVRKSIDNATLIDLIATGLPNFVADRVDREKLKKTEDLYNEVGKLEHLVCKKNNFEAKKKCYNSKEKTEKMPCEICKNKGKGSRFHPETECWFKGRENKVKHVNNSVLEVELDNTDPKN